MDNYYILFVLQEIFNFKQQMEKLINIEILVVYINCGKFSILSL